MRPAHLPRIGVSARFQYGVAGKPGYLRKNVYYLEESFARWLQRGGALVFLIPDVLQQTSLSLADYAAELDGLVLQGGTDISPKLYGEEPAKPEWEGDPPRDRYEFELVSRFMDARKPVLGICRGHQLLNVVLGGSLWQDTHTQMPGAHVHQDIAAYDDRFHRVAIEPGSGLARLYPGVAEGKVNSIHHQAVKKVGRDLKIEAHSTDDQVIEAIRYTGPSYALGVQWHPEFHDARYPDLLDGQPILKEFLGHAQGR